MFMQATHYCHGFCSENVQIEREHMHKIIITHTDTNNKMKISKIVCKQITEKKIECGFSVYCLVPRFWVNDNDSDRQKRRKIFAKTRT